MDLFNLPHRRRSEDPVSSISLVVLLAATLIVDFFEDYLGSDHSSDGFLTACFCLINAVLYRIRPATNPDKPHLSFRNEFWFRTTQLQGKQLKRSLTAPVNISVEKRGMHRELVRLEKSTLPATFTTFYDQLRSNTSGQLCAIKEVQVISNDTRSKEHLKQIYQEICFLEQLSHPNIVQYRGSILNDDVLSVYTEYASKGSIDNLLRKDGPFEECQIRHFTTGILSGLAYLHGMNIVHRDIKGANILVTAYDEVKLADFGLAKHISSLAEVHSSDKGTVYWMAPELILSKHSGKGYNVAVDIWSLGCTIIEMATARHPWSQYDAAQAMHKIAFTEDIPEIPESLSNEGKDFVQLCLNRVATFRPSATELMDHDFIKNERRASFSQMRVQPGKCLEIC